ncbi:hypothetical protein ACFLQ8_01670, partial [Candidatus Auribacterota bacterium]
MKKIVQSIICVCVLFVGIIYSYNAWSLAPTTETDETLQELRQLTETVDIGKEGAYLFGLFELGPKKISDILAQTETLLGTPEVAQSHNRIIAAQRLLLKQLSEKPIETPIPQTIGGDRTEDVQFLTSTIPEIKTQYGDKYFDQFIDLLGNSDVQSLNRMADILKAGKVKVNFLSSDEMEKQLGELGITDWKVLKKQGYLKAPQKPGQPYQINIRNDLTSAEALRVLIHDLSHYAMEASGIKLTGLEKEQIALNNELILCQLIGLPVEKRYMGPKGQQKAQRDIKKGMGRKVIEDERVWFDTKDVFQLSLPEE